jgi:Fic family protein
VRPHFTISEYYDRNRDAFYFAIQGVRDSDMDMTGWLDYYVTGLSTQLTELQERSTQAIQVELLTHDYTLNERQAAALYHLLAEGFLSIHAYQNLFPNISRRSLQRDLRALVEKGLLIPEGSTNQLVYHLGRQVIEIP